MPGVQDPVWTLYRTLLGYSAIAILIFVAGAAEYLHFEPFSSAPSVHAKVVGVFSYDPATGKTTGPDRESFSRGDQFAAVVDWSGLPDTIDVEAIWYDSFENIVGRVGPGKATDLRDQTVVPASVPQGLKFHLPGEYIFAIERLDGRLPVEVLGRRIVIVERA